MMLVAALQGVEKGRKSDVHGLGENELKGMETQRSPLRSKRGSHLGCIGIFKETVIAPGIRDTKL